MDCHECQCLVSRFLSAQHFVIFCRRRWVNSRHFCMFSAWWLTIAPQLTRGLDPMLFHCWSTSYGAGPTMKHHWIKSSCLLGPDLLHIHVTLTIMLREMGGGGICFFSSPIAIVTLLCSAKPKGSNCLLFKLAPTTFVTLQYSSSCMQTLLVLT